MWDQILCKITVATIALIYGLSVVSSYWYLTKYPSWITELRQLKIKGGGQADLGAGVTRGEALYYIFAPWFPVINTYLAIGTYFDHHPKKMQAIRNALSACERFLSKEAFKQRA